MIQAQNKETIK